MLEFVLCLSLSCLSLSQDRRNHDSQRHNRILRFSLRKQSGQCSPHFAAISLLDYTVNLEEREKITGENSKNAVETAHQNCRFLSLVMVERVLIVSSFEFVSCWSF